MFYSIKKQLDRRKTRRLDYSTHEAASGAPRAGQEAVNKTHISSYA